MSINKIKDNSIASSNQIIQNNSSSTIPNLNNNNSTLFQENTQLFSTSENQLFLYINPSSTSTPFKVTPQTQTPNFSILKYKYKFVICITIPSDSLLNSILLKSTIDSLYQNFSRIKEIGLHSSSILICLFIKTIENPSSIAQFYVGNDINISSSLEHFGMIHRLLNQNEFLCNFISFPKTLNFLDGDIDGLIFSKNIPMKDIEIYELFYEQICSNVIDISNDNDNEHYFPLFGLFINGGIHLNDDCIKRLIISTYEENKEHLLKACAFPSLITVSNDDSKMNIFHKIKKYEKVHYNIYDLYYHIMTSSPIINTECAVYKLTPHLLEDINSFYKNEISIDATCEYHNNKLSIYLSQLGYEINYIPSIEIKQTKVKEYDYSDIMTEHSNLFQSNFVLNFHLFETELLICNESTSINKVLLTCFYLMGSFFEFIFPSLCLLVIYCIYYEGFALTNSNSNAAIFFSLIYVMFIIVFCFVSLASPVPNKNRKLFLYLGVVYNIYIYFTLIIAIPAIHFIRVDKHETLYEFNTGAMVVFIVINFLIGILPMLLNAKKIISTFVEMLIYLVLGSPSYTGLFLVHGICNCANSFGKGKEYYNFKSLIGVFYIVLNAGFSFLIMTLTDRKARVNCVFGLSIILTFYNGVKMFIIVWSKLFVISKGETLSMSDASHYGIAQWIMNNEGIKTEKNKQRNNHSHSHNNHNHSSSHNSSKVENKKDKEINIKDDNMDIESHNKAFMANQYGESDNDSVIGQNCVIEQYKVDNDDNMKQMNKQRIDNNRSVNSSGDVDNNEHVKDKKKKINIVDNNSSNVVYVDKDNNERSHNYDNNSNTENDVVNIQKEESNSKSIRNESVHNNNDNERRESQLSHNEKEGNNDNEEDINKQQEMELESLEQKLKDRNESNVKQEESEDVKLEED